MSGTTSTHGAPDGVAPAGFEPRITAFVCNWCTYAGADLTGTSRIKFQPNVRVLRLPCTGASTSCWC